jgi:hypothetical protein
MMSNKVTVNLDMFSALVNNIIVSNLNGTLIVTMDGRTAKQRDTHIRQSQCNQRSSEVVSVSARYSTSVLDRATDFFLLRHEIKEVPKEETINSG